jgi:predicted dinucleotide-binding enzyme
MTRGEARALKIGIIGAGRIGSTAARLLTRAGHQVAISNSRGPHSLRALVEEVGPRAHAMTVNDAARLGDVVLLAVPWRSPEALPAPETVFGKVVIDAMNPYSAEGKVIDLAGSSSGEETARRLPGARIVKAFNTIWCEHLANRGRTDLPLAERHAIFLASDDANAKALVSRLIDEIGFAPVDTGSLREGGRRQEPNTTLYGKVMTGRAGVEAVRALSASRSSSRPPDRAEIR